jgi:methyltransferase (TIGR00027 family)
LSNCFSTLKSRQLSADSQREAHNGSTPFTKDGTAQGVAKQRFIESLAPHGQRVIFDPDAKHFIAGSRFIRLMGHKLNLWLSTKLAPGMHEHLIARTRFIDELVARCAAEGIEQYVILGAGYDLRAHRLSLPTELAVFEVDQEEVQVRKRSKLPEARASQSRPTYVSVDFSSQSLSQRLLESGFDQTKSTLFTLEGVSQYVSKEALKKTLSELKILSARGERGFLRLLRRRASQHRSCRLLRRRLP